MTTTELQKIVATLPIGYYVGTGIEVEVKEQTEVGTSYYNPKENKIVIDGAIINTGLERLPENYDTEKAVRSMLYHEVSHALLTPKDLYCTDIINVFEDERIETILDDYYMNVDFKEQVFAINNFNGEAPKDGWDYFYQITRFRKGEQEDLDEVERIIDKYSDLTATTDNYHKINMYTGAITALYNKCCAKYGNPPENHNTCKWDKSEAQVTMGSESANGSDGENGEGEGIEMSEAEKADLIGKIHDKNKDSTARRGGKQSLRGLLSSAINGVDEGLTDEIRQIFNSYKSRQLNNGKAMNGYSGIFDPRSVARDDYKYFIRPCSKGSGQGFSKFNLNLFIDCSGSYRPNVNRTNCLIRSLEAIEKENPAFTFTVTCMEVGEWTLPKEKRYIEALGGNSLDANLSKIYNDLQRGDAVNYNIVLFDGWTDGGKYFSAFNHNNVSILSDDDNRKYIDKHAKNAKVKYLSSGYAKELTEKVCEILKIAFC